jgi:Rrf2 family protein
MGAEYAVRCVLYLTGKGENITVNRYEIAQAMGIPHQFLGKIAQQLARAGILAIVQGAKGGLKLSVTPEKLTLLDVVEAITGEIFLNDCVLRPGSCFKSQTCSVHMVWEKARSQLRGTLREATFTELLKEGYCPAGRG